MGSSAGRRGAEEAGAGWRFLRLQMKQWAASLALGLALAMCPLQGGAMNKGPQDAGTGRSGLPYAGDRTFATLDEYLAYLEYLSTADRPHYRRVSPELYELVPGTPLAQPLEKRFFSRQELLEKYGFDH